MPCTRCTAWTKRTKSFKDFLGSRSVTFWELSYTFQNRVVGVLSFWK
jgi:hypothetical protein